MKNTISTIVFSLLLSGAFAQMKLPGNMFYNKLDNGLDVLIVEDNSVPLVTIQLTSKNGSYTETPEYSGLSHLYEHMFFKANKDYPSQNDFLQKVTDLGIAFNGTTSEEKVDYFFTLPSFHVGEGLSFMNSAIRYPKFDEGEMQRENIVVDSEFQRQESNPYFALLDEINHHVWGDLYNRKNAIGNHEVIRSATPAKMQVIKNKYYWPNNSLLTIAGNVKHGDILNQVKAIFGNWQPSGFDPFKKWPIPEFKPIQKTTYFIANSKLESIPVLMYNWQGPDTRRDIPATYAADVFSYIMDQNSSKLSKSLVDAGLALQVGISYLTLKHTGPISLFVVPNPSRIEECVAEVKRQINLFDSNDYVTDEQIETAKRILEIRQVQEQEVTSDFVHVLSFWWASASIDYFTTYVENLNKVTRADMQKYIRKYIKGQPYVAGMLIAPQDRAKLKPETFFKAD